MTDSQTADDDELPDGIEPLPQRPNEGHKGTFGRALLIGGSRGMTGAITLAGMATLRSGAGLVRLAVPNRCLETVAAFDPCYLLSPLADDGDGRISARADDAALATLLEQATAVAIGPGLGRSATLTKLVGQLYATVRQPMVVDADALNALAELGDAIQQPAGPRILTPHPGEFARLSDDPIGDESERIAAAAKLAKRMRAIVVLKGHRTVVADGRDHYVNETGNPGMATGGTGDVLTGVITGLLCLGSDPFDAARLGVYVHGLAGDLAATEVGQTSLTASDLVEQLSDAWSGVAP